jgi:hypothetical protein
MNWSSIEVCLPLVLCFIEAAAGLHKAQAGRNTFRTSALLRPKISGRKSPKEIQGKLRNNAPVCHKNG